MKNNKSFSQILVLRVFKILFPVFIVTPEIIKRFVRCKKIFANSQFIFGFSSKTTIRHSLIFLFGCGGGNSNDWYFFS